MYTLLGLVQLLVRSSSFCANGGVVRHYEKLTPESRQLSDSPRFPTGIGPLFLNRRKRNRRSLACGTSTGAMALGRQAGCPERGGIIFLARFCPKWRFILCDPKHRQHANTRGERRWPRRSDSNSQRDRVRGTRTEPKSFCLWYTTNYAAWRAPKSPVKCRVRRSRGTALVHEAYLRLASSG